MLCAFLSEFNRFLLFCLNMSMLVCLSICPVGHLTTLCGTSASDGKVVWIYFLILKGFHHLQGEKQISTKETAKNTHYHADHPIWHTSEV